MSETRFAYVLTSTLPQSMYDGRPAWSQARNRLYKAAFGKLYRGVLERLEGGQQSEGLLSVRLGPSIIFAYINLRGSAVKIHVIAFEVDWCASDDGWDGDGAGLDSHAYDAKVVTTAGRLYLEDGEFLFEQLSGEPIEWPANEARSSIIDRGEEMSFIAPVKVQLRINVMPERRIDPNSASGIGMLMSVVEVSAVRKNQITGALENIDASEFLANLDSLSPEVVLTFNWKARNAAEDLDARDDSADEIEDRDPEF